MYERTKSFHNKDKREREKKEDQAEMFPSKFKKIGKRKRDQAQRFPSVVRRAQGAFPHSLYSFICIDKPQPIPSSFNARILHQRVLMEIHKYRYGEW